MCIYVNVATWILMRVQQGSAGTGYDFYSVWSYRELKLTVMLRVYFTNYLLYLKKQVQVSVVLILLNL